MHDNVYVLLICYFRFRQELWAEVDLESAQEMVWAHIRIIPTVAVPSKLKLVLGIVSITVCMADHYGKVYGWMRLPLQHFHTKFPQVSVFWTTYESLPVEQKEWDASRKLKTEIEHYLQILPLLKKLHSKEIRNRHWLQVMNVANCTFQLEGSIFKMAHLLDAGLLL